MSPAGDADSAAWGFADMYRMEPEAKATDELSDVKGDDWRNILVWGRAQADGVYPETLALVGRARYLADQLGCRVEVLLMGEDLAKATEVLRKYPIDTVYRVEGPDYAPLDHNAKVLEQVVRKRRPEMVLVFQSRTGDAVTAYTANRLGVGFVTGALQVDVDTAERRAVVTHQASNSDFQVVTRMLRAPQFISVQRGLFRAPMEDPYANVRVHDLKVEAGRLADIHVLARRPAPEPRLEHAERVVVVGARVYTREQIDLARELARRLGAVFGVAQSIVERGMAESEREVSRYAHRVRPKLLVTVGVQGSLDFLEAIEGNPTIAALASEPEDPIAQRAAYLVRGRVEDAVKAVLDAL